MSMHIYGLLLSGRYLLNCAKTFLGILVLAQLVACSSTHMANVSKHLRPVQGQPVGYFFGSMGNIEQGEQQSVFSISKIQIRRVSDKEPITLLFSASKMFPTVVDASSEHAIESVFLEPVVPGSYEIYKVEFYFNSGTMEARVWNKDDFSIPLEIVDGEAIYIGSFLAGGAWGKNIIGQRAANTSIGYFILRDRYQRDVSILKTKNPDFSDSIELRIPEIPDEASYFIRKSEI